MKQIIVFGKRKPGMNLEEFQRYYETKHAVLGERYLGGVLVKFRRYYPTEVRHLPVQWTEQEAGRAAEAAYDVITVYSFRDDTSEREFEKRWSDPELRRAFLEDEQKFMDRTTTLFGFCDGFEGERIASEKYL
jgi:hypothetical protein